VGGDAMNYEHQILCDDGEEVYVLAKDLDAALQEALERGYKPVDPFDELVFRAMKDFGFDGIDSMSKFDTFKAGFNYGVRHQLQKELDNLRGEHE
jgi:hypothetical protein